MMMAEYIEREAAIREMYKEPSYYDLVNILTEVRDRIRAIPAADVREDVKARWEEDFLEGLPGYRPIVIVCSNCHLVSSARFPYCPNCGAKMEVTNETD